MFIRWDTNHVLNHSMNLSDSSIATIWFRILVYKEKSGTIKSQAIVSVKLQMNHNECDACQRFLIEIKNDCDK